MTTNYLAVTLRNIGKEYQEFLPVEAQITDAVFRTMTSRQWVEYIDSITPCNRFGSDDRA